MARTLTSRRSRRGQATVAAAVVLTFSLAACGGGSSGSSAASGQTSGVTITVTLAAPAPPKDALAAFTKQTGITVKWVDIDWDSLQTKISAAAAANTYFADATDVDWSRVVQLDSNVVTVVTLSILSGRLPEWVRWVVGGCAACGVATILFVVPTIRPPAPPS